MKLKGYETIDTIKLQMNDLVTTPGNS